MTNSGPAIALLFCLPLLLAPSGPGAAQPKQNGGEVLPALVEGTSLVVLGPDGRRVAGTALIGAVVVGRDPSAGRPPSASIASGLIPTIPRLPFTTSPPAIRGRASGSPTASPTRGA